MSRKMSFSMALAVVMMLVFSGLAFAQTPAVTEEATPATPPTTVGCPNGIFVDADGDGLCDNYENGATHQMWGPQWGAQRGSHMGGMMQPHRNFVDEDEDGVCDNCDGTGNAQHSMHGGMGGRFSRPMGRQATQGQGMNNQGMGHGGWGR